MQKFREEFLREPIGAFMWVLIASFFFVKSHLISSTLLSFSPFFSPFSCLSLPLFQNILCVKWRACLKIHLWDSFLWNGTGKFWFLKVLYVWQLITKGIWHFLSFKIIHFFLACQCANCLCQECLVANQSRPWVSGFYLVDTLMFFWSTDGRTLS